MVPLRICCISVWRLRCLTLPDNYSQHFVENRPQRIQEQWRTIPIWRIDQLAVQNVWYNVPGPPASDLRMLLIRARVDVAAETLQMEVDCDGQTFPSGNFAVATPAGTNNYVFKSFGGDRLDSLADGNFYSAAGVESWEMQSCTGIRFRKTTNNNPANVISVEVRVEQL